MAKITPSPLLSEITGSAGGATFKSSPQGPLMYNRPLGPTGKTSWQCLQSIALHLAALEWSGLDQDMQTYWNERARSEQLPTGAERFRGRTGRMHFMGWRVKLHHTGYYIPPTTEPSSPLYYTMTPRILLYRGGLGFQFYTTLSGEQPPFPHAAAFMSWPPDGRRKPGRTWHKIWPQYDHIGARQCVDMDQDIWNVCGIPPELRPYASGFQPQRVRPLIIFWRIHPYGQIGIAWRQPLEERPNGYYFKIPPDPPVYT